MECKGVKKKKKKEKKEKTYCPRGRGEGGKTQLGGFCVLQGKQVNIAGRKKSLR